MKDREISRSPEGGATGGLSIDIEDTEAALGEAEPLGVLGDEIGFI